MTSEVTLGFQEFEFDLPPALLDQIVKRLDAMASGPLTVEHVHSLPNAQGVYQLLLDGEIVYIGKTDAEAGLRARLERHAYSIQQRTNLDAAQMQFKALRVFVFAAMDLETQLIRHYRAHSGVGWNDSGFGSNDPGRNRDKTELKDDGFDFTYPIDVDVPLSVVWPVDATIEDALRALSSAVPYTVRAERLKRGSRQPHTDLQAAIGFVPSSNITAREVMVAACKALPVGWQATALAGRIILYKETDTYPHGRLICRS